MIKVFVVDDEERQRRSIVRHVSWEQYQMEVTGDWEGANEALEAAKQSVPDLLITDIRLLGTDGLELSSRMRRLNPNIRIIMVTGYEEFHYAKTALDIGVDAFLIKPVIFEDLNAALARIGEEEQSKLLKSKEETQLKEQIDALRAANPQLFGGEENAEQKKSHSQIVVQKAIDYMSMHYRDDLSLRSVAESVYLSPNYLGALFRSELGESFTDRLIRIRIQKAKEMLKHPEFKLYEVAEQVGYQNIGYFTGLFKRMTGLSPKEYRDIHGYL
ncbi:response regulator transcription factor [Paenibacillus glycanilyticus]|uniref:DNA-binding response regulator n=1 Tax=Paenibacillus glycanilyticus TaxID=126569 RepID=A0ABQ6G8Y1_9BACL|nr:response regulator [Paenibacillus glycanilyticus]GLX66713.1 DNA-binding response regulator [Paenibacillus glycanilyticus]